MSAQKVLECYHKLSTSEQQFCQACALVFFRPLYQADYLPYLRALDIRFEGGKSIDQGNIRLLIEKCRALSLLDNEWQIHQEIRHPLVLEALNNSSLLNRIMQIYGILPGGQYLLKGKGRFGTKVDEWALLCLKIYA